MPAIVRSHQEHSLISSLGQGEYMTNSDIYEIASVMVVRFAGCSLL